MSSEDIIVLGGLAGLFCWVRLSQQPGPVVMGPRFREDDEKYFRGCHGKSPRIVFAARTFSTPIAIAAVRCGILSTFDRITIWSKARSRM